MRPLLLVFILGVCHCLQAEPAELLKVNVGYAPNVWFVHVPIIKAEGWDKEIGLDFAPKCFPGPPTQIQAFAAGEMDVIYNNVASPLPLGERGVEIVIVASTIKDDIFLAARPELMKLRASKGPVEAVRAFKEIHGRQVKIATNPKGSLSDLVLRYWLSQSFSKPDEWVQVINAGTQDQFQQAILGGAVDAASVFEPLWTISKKLDPKLEIFLEPKEMMTDQPGGIVAVRKTFAEKHPEVLGKLAALQIRAVEFLRRNPERAAFHACQDFGKGLIDQETMLASIKFARDRFTADPAVMIAPTKIIQEFMLQNGYLQKRSDIDRLFQTQGFHEALREQKESSQ